jgi:hypothetical protein
MRKLLVASGMRSSVANGSGEYRSDPPPLPRSVLQHPSHADHTPSDRDCEKPIDGANAIVGQGDDQDSPLWASEEVLSIEPIQLSTEAASATCWNNTSMDKHQAHGAVSFAADA